MDAEVVTFKMLDDDGLPLYHSSRALRIEHQLSQGLCRHDINSGAPPYISILLNL